MYKDEIILKFNDRDFNNKIAATLMVKDEERRIETTMKSCLGFVNKFIIYDTGSTDNTIEIIKDFCNKYKIPLYLIQGVFVDFSTSRNVLLDYADTIENTDFLLFLDSNDELKNGHEMVKICNNISEKVTAIFVKQRWKAGNYIDYMNIKLVRNKCNWRYIGVVHEYIDRIGYEKGEKVIINVDNFFIYQDRSFDEIKSIPRFTKDKELLLNEYKGPNKTSRTVFYLGQTCECLGHCNDMIKYYTERMDMVDGFFEERYHAAYKLGLFFKNKRKHFSIYSGYFLFALGIMFRAEPLVRCAEYYISIHNWESAYFFIKKACELDVPKCGLFIDIECYLYYRWHLMGIVAYYVKEYEIGLKACKIAIEQRNNDIDKHNLNFYENELHITNEILKLELL